MAKLLNEYLAGKYPVGNNRLGLYDRLFGNKLFGSYEKSIDFSPVISVSDALAKPALYLITKITAVQAGSGDPSPVNIRDISGWSDGEITRAGKNIINLADIQIPNGSAQTNIWSGTITGRYTLSFTDKDITSVANPNSRFVGITLDGSRIYPSYDQVKNGYTFDGELSSISIYGNGAYSKATGKVSFQLEVGQTATAYAPYNGTVYPVSWPEAGIVYGGLNNVTAGALAVTHAIKTYTGSSGESWNYSERDGSRRVFIVLDGAKPSATDFWSNIASGGADSSYPDPWKMRTNGNARPSLIIGVDNTIGSANDWKALLAETNMVVIYPLAEPITYTLTPTEIALLDGDNTIWSKTGDVSMKYLAKR